MADLIGTTIGQYKIVELLGRGGMADVYKAFHADLELYRAIKFIRPEFVQESDFRARFRKEAQSVAALRHPNIVQVHDFGSHDDSFYMVMEFIEGQDLKKVILERGPIEPIGQAVDWVCQIASALEYAHAEDLVHRDIKPENIMLNARGIPILTDFGIAKLLGRSTQLTQTGMGIGTPAYMSPEQAKGESDVGPGADVYSLSVVLYELLTGTTPFNADTPMGIMLKAISEPLPLPRKINASISQPLQDVIVNATLKHPADRTPTATEFRTQLLASMETPTDDEDATMARTPRQREPLAEPEVVGVGADAAPQTVKRSRLGMWLSLLLVVLVGTAGLLMRDELKRESTSPASIGDPVPLPFEINAKPKDARIAFLNIEQPYSPGMLLPPGGYNVEVTARGFVSAQFWLEHNESTAIHPIELATDPQPISVAVAQEYTLPFEIRAEPEDAQIVFLNVEQPYSPEMLLPPGRYNVEVTALGFVSARVWLEHNESTPTHHIELETDRQPFSVNVAQVNAQIEFLDASQNYLPGMRLPPGDYRLEVSAHGYDNQAITVSHGREPTNHYVDLKITRYPFTILTEPIGATVRVLNIEERYHPAIPLPPGDYRVEVAANGYVTETVELSHELQATEHRLDLALAIIECTVRHTGRAGVAGTFTGTCRGGKPHGSGLIEQDNGNNIKGVWENGQLNGYAVLQLTSGFRYEGEFRDDSAHGRGTQFHPDGARFVGEFREGHKTQGTFVYADGSHYEGEFRDDKMHGQGTYEAKGFRQVGHFQNNQLWNGWVYTPSGKACEVKEHKSVVEGCVRFN